MARTNRVSLENVLLREKFITDKNIEKAGCYQKNNEGNLSEIFVKLGLVTEEQVVIGLAKQLGIPHMKLTNYKLDSEIVEIVPEKIIRRNKIVPLSKSGKTLTIATSNPLDILVIDDLKAATGCHIETIVCTPSEIEQVIGDYYSITEVNNLQEKEVRMLCLFLNLGRDATTRERGCFPPQSFLTSFPRRKEE